MLIRIAYHYIAAHDITLHCAFHYIASIYVRFLALRLFPIVAIEGETLANGGVSLADGGVTLWTYWLGLKCVFKHQNCQMFGLINMGNLHPLEVVSRASETQLQVGEN